MNPSYNEPLWIECLRWGIVALAWFAACWAVLVVPPMLKQQYKYLVMHRSGRRRPKNERVLGLYRA